MEQVVIADDGSDQRTRMKIAEVWQASLPIVYTWQPDSDFRASRSRNLALSKVESDYVIFIDGDCLIPPCFVERHLQLSAKKTIVAGGRVLLSKYQTTNLLTNPNVDGRKYFKGFKFAQVPLGVLRDCQPTNWQMVRTCNMSAHISDLKNSMGFDESYIGWGLEDSDLVVRLIRDGCSVRSGRLAVVTAHLHHDTPASDKKSQNQSLFERLQRDNHRITPSHSILLEL